MSSVEEQLRLELAQLSGTLQERQQQLESLDAAIADITEENRSAEADQQLVHYEAALKQRLADMPAEDAMDGILRLQNQLNVVRRRNELLTRENATRQRTVHAQARQLQDVTKAVEQLIEITGWSPGYKAPDMNESAAHKTEMTEMAKLEARIRHDLKSAKGIIQRKEQTIVALNQKLAGWREKDNVLNALYNDIRVKTRDCAELEAKLQRLRDDGGNVDRALVKMEEAQVGKRNTLTTMEMDNSFLQQVSAELKQTCRRQDDITRAQLTRQDQLQKRLDIIRNSLRETKKLREFERSVDTRALVSADAGEEPQDVAQILPESETIPIDTYRLLYRNNQMLRTQMARKNMLALEKESVQQALQAKLANFIQAFNITAKQDEGIRTNKTTEMGDLLDDLQTQHQSYRNRIDDLTNDNRMLRHQLAGKRTASREHSMPRSANNAIRT